MNRRVPAVVIELVVFLVSVQAALVPRYQRRVTAPDRPPRSALPDGLLPLPPTASFAEGPKGDCPKVFVYRNLSQPFQDLDLKLEPQALRALALGRRIPSITGFWKTSQLSGGVLFLYRMLSATRCVTDDPTKADLFYIPLLAKPKKNADFNKACTAVSKRRKDLLDQLPYLTEATARRHFFVFGKAYYSCNTGFGFYREPQGLFEQMAGLSYQPMISRRQLQEFPGLIEQHGEWRQGKYLKHIKEHHRYLRTYTIPYPTNIHWGRHEKWDDMPWVAATNRTSLASYVGGFHHGDVLVRSQLKAWCHKYAKEKASRTGGPVALECSSFSTDPEMYQKMVAMKRRSVFCLEPLGDSIGRKSVLDDYSCGCIPIFIGYAQAYLYPESWDGWFDKAFFLLDRRRLISGELDPVQVLERIPADEVEEVQQHIRVHGNKLLINEHEDPSREDAISVLLRRLQADATKKTH